MSKGSTAAGPAMAATAVVSEAVTRPIHTVDRTTRRSRVPLRNALASACKLTLLAGYVTGVYLAVAVGLGALFGWPQGWQSALRLAAVAVTAVGFSTARPAVDRAVDRLLRPAASPYDVLASLVARLGSAGSIEEALPSLARLLCEGTGARHAAVWLRSGSGFVRVAGWPASPDQHGPASLGNPAELGARDDIDVFAAVRDGRELLGALTIELPGGRLPVPPEIRLVSDLANSAGFLLRNTLLTAELAERLRTVTAQAAELRASRRRLVVARDVARRRLAHELRVSVQAPITAIRDQIAKLQDTGAAGSPGADRVRALITAAQTQIDAIIARFRSVIHGIHPPALSDHGLVAAVEGVAATLPRETRISVHAVDRYPMEVESTLYFCAAAVLRVMAAGDQASALRIRLADTGRNLVLTVIDESRSDDMGDEQAVLEEMHDRVGAFGGAVTATAIEGRLWVQATLPLARPPGWTSASAARANDTREVTGPAAARGGAGAGARGGITAGRAGARAESAAAARAGAGAARSVSRSRARRDTAFWAAFTGYSAFSAAWLALGLLIGIVANVSALRHAVARLAHGGHPSWLADIAAGVVAGLPKSYPAGEVVLDYAFSILNVAIAVALLRQASRDRTVRLLAVGMIGSASGFNLQAHASIEAIQRMTGLGIGWWHSLLLHGVGGVAYIFALLLFPTGRLHGSGRSRWAGGALALAGLAGAAALLAESTAQYPHTVSFVVFFGLLTPIVGSTAQWRRYVHADTADSHQQSAVLLWALGLAFSAATLLSVAGLAIRIAQVPGFSADPQALVFWTFRAMFTVIPCALMAGVLRFRLWDIERLFNRTFVYGLLALLIGAAYVVLVVGADLLLGLPRRQNPVIQIAATAAVVLALAPARSMLTRAADRVAYGQRPAPYHVLARLSALSQATLSGVASLPSLARIAGQGLGARACEVRLARPDGQLEIAAWRAPGASAPASRSGSPCPPGATIVSVPVIHRGATVGEIAVEPPAGGLAPAERRLLARLAEAAGLVLHNARLSVELERRLAVITEQAAAISASRRRIAAAQAGERRMLERNLHDGAQPHLIALRMSLGLAAHRLGGGDAVGPADSAGPADAAAALDRIAAQMNQASTNVSEIAQGLYPPELAEGGLCAALRAHLAAMPGMIGVRFDESLEAARFDPDVEAAVCFACLEALQNAHKYAPGAQLSLALARDGDGVRFTVADTGPGVDPEAAPGFGLQSMEDRVAAVGGTLEFRSEPGEGTTVSGWVPAVPMDGRREPAPYLQRAG